MKLPFTEKKLEDWAGPKTFPKGRDMFRAGAVAQVKYEHPFVTAQLSGGIRGMRTKFELLPSGLVENHCPCRDNQERGLICSHLVAAGLAALRQYSDPDRADRAEKEMRRAKRMEQVDEQRYITRVPSTRRDSIAARLRITLVMGWRKLATQDRYPLRAAVEYSGRTVPLGEVPTDLPLSFTPRDENLLFVLEDICGGPARSEMTLSGPDLVNLLELCTSKPIYDERTTTVLTVVPEFVPTAMRIRMNEETGELHLSMHAGLPGTATEQIILLGGTQGWIFDGKTFRKLEQVLPAPLRSIYYQEMRVPRPAVPNFLASELPALEKLIPVDSDLTSDLLTLVPATPRFRLVISGSRASLSAKLFAEYGETTLIAGRDEAAGKVALPSADDLYEYRVRNMAAEKKALLKLERCGFQGTRGDLLGSVVGPREVLNVLGGAIPRLRRSGWRVEIEGKVSQFMEKTPMSAPVVEIRETPGGGYFDVGYAYEGGRGESLTEADIQRALNKGDSFVEKGGRTVLLDIDAIESAREVFSDCAVGPGSLPGTFRMNNIYAPYVQSSLISLDGLDVEAPEEWMQRAASGNRAEKIEPEPLGKELEKTLRGYQKQGVYWLRFLERNGLCGILADEMGLGKTLQALAWLQIKRHRDDVRTLPSLIVCPTSLVENWAEESERFTPGLRVLKMHGAERHERWDEMDKHDLIITSYALLRRDLDQYLRIHFSVAILDEAQHIKNRTTRNAVAAKKLRTAHRVVLTGTPIENSVSDLWSIMDFLMPGYLGTHKAFREHYELPISRGGAEGDRAQVKLRRKLHPFLMRRLKREVARDLPQKIERIAHCSMSKDQQLVYQGLVDNARRKITDLVEAQGFDRSRIQILRTLLRLRQTCCHLDLLKLPDLKSTNPSAKMELFFELVDEALDAQHRILIFSQFTSMLAILRKEFARRKLKYCYLDGATKDRQSRVREFNTDRSIPAFLISLKAGGSGLNLTGADMVIHYDPWWNPAVEDQATDRAHRIGQKKTVYSVKLITKNSVEEKVLQLQKRKKSVIDATLEKEADFAKALTWEDVQDLLSVEGDGD